MCLEPGTLVEDVSGPGGAIQESTGTCSSVSNCLGVNPPTPTNTALAATPTNTVPVATPTNTPICTTGAGIPTASGTECQSGLLQDGPTVYYDSFSGRYFLNSDCTSAWDFSGESYRLLDGAGTAYAIVSFCDDGFCTETPCASPTPTNTALAATPTNTLEQLEPTPTNTTVAATPTNTTVAATPTNTPEDELPTGVYCDDGNGCAFYPDAFNCSGIGDPCDAF